MKLCEMCNIIMGQSPESTSYNEAGDGIPFFQGNADFGETTPNVRIWCNHPTKIAKAGDILISVRAPIGALNIANQECCIGRGLAAITIDASKCSQRYIWYALESKKAELNSKGTGSTFKAINKNTLFDTEIPYVSLTQQKQIGLLLDHVSSIISHSKMLLELFDELVLSRFMEQFDSNKTYPEEQLDNNVLEMFIGPFGSALKNECFVEESEGYCIVYEQKHAIQKSMDVPTRYIDENKYKELKRFAIHPGDIIVSCRGTIGEIYVVPENAPLGVMHPSIMKIRLNDKVYNRTYFVFALKRYMEEHISEAKGSGVKMAVTASTLGKELFLVPPLPLQEQFAAFVEQTDKSKFVGQINQNL